jgi:hypothetical protein
MLPSPSGRRVGEQRRNVDFLFGQRDWREAYALEIIV